PFGSSIVTKLSPGMTSSRLAAPAFIEIDSWASLFPPRTNQRVRGGISLPPRQAWLFEHLAVNSVNESACGRVLVTWTCPMRETCGVTSARYDRTDDRPLPGKTGARPRVLHADQSIGVAAVTRARRHSLGRGHKPHFRDGQIRHAIDMVTRGPLCRT